MESGSLPSSTRTIFWRRFGMPAIAMLPQRSRSWSTTPSRPAQPTCRLTSLVIRARSSRSRSRVTDDGQGMSLKELELALVFGGSSRFGSRDSFGRFGMGLPSASLSLARDVEVRSWRGASMRTVRLSLDDRDGLSRRGVRTRRLSLGDMPTPSGTTVLLRSCDRHGYERAGWLSRSITAGLGRIFRRQLESGLRSLRKR